MTTREFQDLLHDVLVELMEARHDSDHPLADLAERAADITNVVTYDIVGMLTTDKGVLVETDDGDFQVTVVRSR
jgi:hypothetical protein